MDASANNVEPDKLVELERVIAAMAIKMPDKVTAAELYVHGYEPYHRTLRKQTGNYMICWHEHPELESYLQFGCVMYSPKQEEDSDAND